MRPLIALLVFGVFAVLANTAQAACPRPSYSAPYLKTIPSKGINQALFAEALTLEASYARCKRGKKILAQAKGLTKVAASHSGWMARTKKLDHRGAQGFKARMRASGVKFKTAAENIAAFDRYQFPKGQFRVKNAAACRFATSGGAAIAAHSYASLARAVVTGWMASPGHRKNLLNGRIKLTGGGIAFDRAAPNCGRFFITQNYAG
ncbi:MAG: CAP domain-containing protein [Alphaproteobacteria bacterium]|nr:CAP domain-containing protein [Alphaproteobacteria bacterium]